MTKTRPKPPVALEQRGRRFWARTVTTYSLSDAELELLTEACRALDECEALRAAITAEGVTVPGSRGQARVHPAVGELRMTRLALGRLLAQLALPDEEDDTVPSPATLRAKKAAESRWGSPAAVEARRNRRGSA